MSGRFRLDLDEPIVPGLGLGGLRLRTPLASIVESIDLGAISGAVRYEMAAPFEAHYSLAEGAIAVGVDIRNGKVFHLSAKVGYRGLLFDKVRPGVAVAEALKLIPALYYNEAEGVILCRDPLRPGADIAGLALDVGEDDPIPRLVPSMAINAISVFIAELFTREGQQGTW